MDLCPIQMKTNLEIAHGLSNVFFLRYALDGKPIFPSSFDSGDLLITLKHPVCQQISSAEWPRRCPEFRAPISFHHMSSRCQILAYDGISKCTIWDKDVFSLFATRLRPCYSGLKLSSRCPFPAFICNYPMQGWVGTPCAQNLLFLFLVLNLVVLIFVIV